MVRLECVEGLHTSPPTGTASVAMPGVSRIRVLGCNNGERLAIQNVTCRVACVTASTACIMLRGNKRLSCHVAYKHTDKCAQRKKEESKNCLFRIVQN